MRFLLSLLVATLAALAIFTGTATAKKRCCFSAYISGVGVLQSSWGQLSDDQIGSDSGIWAWRERMILVYSESGSSNYPDLQLARIGGEVVVKPSTDTHLETSSTVQFGGPGFYTPVTKPGDCGTQRAKLRRGDDPDFAPRSQADSGALVQFPKAKMFLSAGDPYLVQDQYCLYGENLNNIDVWGDQACLGQGAFWLPAPRRAWLRHGKGHIQKEVQCDGVHEPEVNVNHRTTAIATFNVRLAWFPPRQLKERWQDLKKDHKQVTPGEGPY